jgi:inosose dehydratase
VPRAETTSPGRALHPRRLRRRTGRRTVLSAVTGTDGTDPAALARQVPARIAHLHLKDVDSTLAAKVRSGRLTYTEAVQQGMYRPLGTGDVDVPSIVGHVRAHGYDGWYTLEQDTILTGEPEGEGPVADVRSSAEYLRTILDRSIDGRTDA